MLGKYKYDVTGHFEEESMGSDYVLNIVQILHDCGNSVDFLSAWHRESIDQDRMTILCGWTHGKPVIFALYLNEFFGKQQKSGFVSGEYH